MFEFPLRREATISPFSTLSLTLRPLPSLSQVRIQHNTAFFEHLWATGSIRAAPSGDSALPMSPRRVGGTAAACPWCDIRSSHGDQWSGQVASPSVAMEIHGMYLQTWRSPGFLHISQWRMLAYVENAIFVHHLCWRTLEWRISVRLAPKSRINGVELP